MRALALTVPVPVDGRRSTCRAGWPPVESAAYFAVAEALANVAKHSGATTAWIRLGYRDGHCTVGR